MIAKTQPKVAIMISTNQLSGAQNRAIAIFDALDSQGYPVDLWIEPEMRPVLHRAFPQIERKAVTYRWGNLIDRGLRFWERIPPVWRAMHRLGLMASRGTPTVETLIRSREIDVIHLFLEMRVAYIKNARTMFELTSPDIADLVSQWPAQKLASHDLYHAVSPSVERRFQAAAPDACLLKAPGPFSRISNSPPAALEKTNTVVFAHRFIARKNAVLFARVARRFVERRPDWSVRILGFGDQETEIKKLVANTDGIDVTLEPNLDTVLARSRVFVSLIQPDNYPSQSVMEAMAAGNALLLSDTGDSKEMFLGGNGVATTLDEEVILRDLIDLTSDDAALDTMGAKSRELAQERFDADRYLSHLKATYAQLAMGSD